MRDERNARGGRTSVLFFFFVQQHRTALLLLGATSLLIAQCERVRLREYDGDMGRVVC